MALNMWAVNHLTQDSLASVVIGGLPRIQGTRSPGHGGPDPVYLPQVIVLTNERKGPETAV